MKLHKIIKVPRAKVRNPFVVPVFKRKAGKHLRSARKVARMDCRLEE